MIVNWIGIEDGDRSSILDRLGFEIVGEGDGVSGDYLCIRTPAGWLVIVSPGAKLPLEEALFSLSDQDSVLVGEAYTGSNYASLRAVRCGITQWSIARDLDKSADQFIVEGDLPPSVLKQTAAAEREQLTNKGEGVDYLADVPVEIGQSICGYPFQGGTGSGWALLFKVGPFQQLEPFDEPLLARLKANLRPALERRDWAFESEDADVGRSWSIHRNRNGQAQTLFFEAVEPSKIGVKFEAKSPKDFVSGHIVTPPSKPRSLWRRLTGAKEPKVYNPVDHAIRAARVDVLVAERFLETGEDSSLVLVDRR